MCVLLSLKCVNGLTGVIGQEFYHHSKMALLAEEQYSENNTLNLSSLIYRKLP